MGQNVRRIRQSKGMSLSALAEKSNVAKGTLFRMEHGGGNPTVETLVAIAQSLRVPIEEIFRSVPTEVFKVVRAGEGRDVSDNVAEGLVIFSTFVGQTSLDIQLLTFHEEISTMSPSHGQFSREYVYVLSGDIEIAVDNVVEILNPGDFAVYATDRGHRWRTPNGEARVLLINTAPGEPQSYIEN